ncbi:MAG: acyl-CoA desaturase [Candidatus Sumerlaeota bacterium]
MASLPKSFTSFAGWFDSHRYSVVTDGSESNEVDWLRVIPFFALHVACIGVLWTGISATAAIVAIALYVIRMFAITGFYHRYFSHRAFKTSRGFQFAMAVVGNSSVQRGPLWWAAHHRHHHKHSDSEVDEHSPHAHSFLWSHMLWFMTPKNFHTNMKSVPDLAKFRELCFLDRFDWLVPLLLAAGLFALGTGLEMFAPSLGTNGPQLFIVGFFISTVAVFHCTCFINSLAHVMGKTRFDTGDHSRNSLLLALLTFGEGWHNNHHHYPSSARQGFYWREIDLTYGVLKFLEKLGIVWDMNPVPERILAEGREADRKRS